MKPRRHHELLILLAFVATVLVGAALLAPVLFLASKAFLRFALEHGWKNTRALGWIIHAAEKTELPGYFDRAAMICAVVGLWPLSRLLKLSREDVIGSEWLKRSARNLVSGFIAACVVLLMAGWVFVQVGAATWKARAPWMMIGGPIVTGLCVATLEEFLFRGAMLGVLRRSLAVRAAIVWTTVIFAALHFLKPPPHGSVPDDAVTWTSGFWVITRLFNGFAQWQNLIAEFLLLLAVGWVLAKARIATDGLGAGIGLHAGWVAAMKHFSQIAGTTAGLREGAFAPWIAENHCKAIVGSFVGIVPVIAVLLSGLAILLMRRRPSGRLFR